jgi:hypothetical protein
MRMMNVDGAVIDFDEIVAVLPVASNEFAIVLRGGAKILIPGGAPGAAVKLRDKIIAGMNVIGDISRDTQ